MTLEQWYNRLKFIKENECEISCWDVMEIHKWAICEIGDRLLDEWIESESQAEHYDDW